jgi:hypothetical protein
MNIRRFQLLYLVLLCLVFLTGCAKDNPVTTKNELGVPQLTSPANGATTVSQTPTVTWQAVAHARFYQIQVSQKQDFSTILFDTTWTVTAKEIPILYGNTTYYWHVRAEDSGIVSAWSDTWSFTSGTPTFNSPNVGSSFILQDSRIDSFGSVTAGDIYNFTVTQKNMSVFGRSNVTAFLLGNGQDTSIFYMQYAPNGDVAMERGNEMWMDLPFASGTPYQRVLRDSTNGSYHQKETVTVTSLGAGSVTIGGHTFASQRVQVVTEYLYQDTNYFDDNSYEDIYEWIPEIGFFGAVRSHDAGDRSMRQTITALIQYTLK